MGWTRKRFPSVASKLIEERLSDTDSDDYSAYFVCVLAVCWPDGLSQVFKGKIDGNLIFPPRGRARVWL